MSIRKALFSDLDKMYELTCSCANDLKDQGIFQWSEDYPSKAILERDIELGQIWVLEDEQTIKGIVVLTAIVDAAYTEVEWLSPNENNLYVHRLAVHPEFQGKGLARELMDFSEQYAIDNQYISIRLDTFSQNLRNQKFYENRKYTKLGNVYFKNQSDFPFYCYELVFDQLY